jgi:peptidyl-prolyl cis-trans isomerase SurA
MAGRAKASQSGSPVELDRVIAVVNGHAILASELGDEIRMSAIEPESGEGARDTPPEALQRLIARTLVRQQIRQEDEQSLVPSPEEVSTRLAELRKRLPACVKANCETDSGWSAFLNEHGLSERDVRRYLRGRIELLRFIEQRFRQGTQISDGEIESYYKNTLLPQYPPGQPVPPLEQVSPRIEEILLQEHVTDLFTGWLDNLRTQGDIEILEPSLQSALDTGHANPLTAEPVRKGPAVQ